MGWCQKLGVHLEEFSQDGFNSFPCRIVFPSYCYKLGGKGWRERASLGCWQASPWPYVRARYRKPVYSTFSDELCHRRMVYITINRCVCSFVAEHKSCYAARGNNGKMKIRTKTSGCIQNQEVIGIVCTSQTTIENIVLAICYVVNLYEKCIMENVGVVCEAMNLYCRQARSPQLFGFYPISLCCFPPHLLKYQL